jgi:hypothetical protein
MVFWIFYCPDRCLDEQLDTVFEHFVAPNSVVRRVFLAFGEYDARSRIGNATFIVVRALFLSLQCTSLGSRAGVRSVNRVLAHLG